MTRTEFDEWLDHHCSHFPGVGTWLPNMGDRKVAVLTIWFEYLLPCDFAGCCKATTALYARGDDGPVYERHPQAIRAIIRGAELLPLDEPAKAMRREVADQRAELEAHPWDPISPLVRKVLF